MLILGTGAAYAAQPQSVGFAAASSSGKPDVLTTSVDHY